MHSIANSLSHNPTHLVTFALVLIALFINVQLGQVGNYSTDCAAESSLVQICIKSLIG